MNLTSIRALEITDYDLILQGVSDQFVDDFEDSIEEEERDDDRPVRPSRPRPDSRETHARTRISAAAESERLQSRCCAIGDE